MADKIIPERDADILRKCWGGDPPPEMLHEYWHYRSIRDRCDTSQIQVCELVQLAHRMRLQFNLPPHDNPSKPFDVLEAAGKLKLDFLGKNPYCVRLWWRGTERKAQVIEVLHRSKRVVVIVDNMTRKVDAKLVLGLWTDPDEPRDEPNPVLDKVDLVKA